jgi:hypothetical protein
MADTPLKIEDAVNEDLPVVGQADRGGFAHHVPG